MKESLRGQKVARLAFAPSVSSRVPDRVSLSFFLSAVVALSQVSLGFDSQLSDSFPLSNRNKTQKQNKNTSAGHRRHLSRTLRALSHATPSSVQVENEPRSMTLSLRFVYQRVYSVSGVWSAQREKGGRSRALPNAY